MEYIKLTINDVPDIDFVKDEIITHAIAIINAYLKKEVPKSEAEIAVEETVEAIKAKNPTFTKVAPIESPMPVEEPVE